MAHHHPRAVIIWLISGCALLFVMVVIGGITRLTHSGLSMVNWKPVTGTLPPLNETQWLESFDLYKQSPEFKLVNYDFELEEYKSIFWWEYIHRLLGRLIGLVFIIPFFIFLSQKRFDRKMKIKLVILLLLGGLQGLIGWYMVKSGLVKNPAVSQYRLAVHLLTAFLIICYTTWLVFEFSLKNPATREYPAKLKKLMLVYLGVLTLQIFYGALVAGLKAGMIYNSFPKMGDQWIAESVTYALSQDGLLALFENPATVQFLHRIFAYLTFFIAIGFWIMIYRSGLFPKLKKGASLLLSAVSFQFILGILTLLLQVPVWLGVLHQFGALFVLLSTVYCLFLIYGKPAYAPPSLPA